MISRSPLEVIWTDHARERWQQRFPEADLPEINRAAVQRAANQGFKRLKIVAGPVTAAVDLTHFAKAVVTTVFETGLHEKDWRR